MLIINFAHPLTPDQCTQLETLTGEAIERVIDVTTQLDVGLPLIKQVVALVDTAGLTPAEWQTQPLLINPPGLAPAALALLAELHGRMGYFPAIIRIRPVPGSIPTRYKVAEILNLQALREAARKRRAVHIIQPEEL